MGAPPDPIAKDRSAAPLSVIAPGFFVAFWPCSGNADRGRLAAELSTGKPDVAEIDPDVSVSWMRPES